MITDALLAPLLAVLNTVIGWLPEGEPIDVGPVETVWTALRQFDSLVPVLGPVVAMLTLLSAVVAFVLVRLVLTVWNIVYP